MFKDILRGLPVSINNLADPAMLKKSTAAKLDTLCKDRHSGPVALITKGNLDKPWWRERLTEWSKRLDLYVFASISELPWKMEPVGRAHRYRTLTAARESGATAIAYVRPIINQLNDSAEIIGDIFCKSAGAGAHAIVSSGFRGDTEVVEASGIAGIPAPDGQEWMKTLKLTPQSTADFMRELAHKLDMPYWTRTACAVSALRGQTHTWSPYWLAPKFVGCEFCPLSSSCLGMAQFRSPALGSLELLEYLGFKVEIHMASARFQRCDVEIRSQCTLCCTNCPTAPASFGAPYINVRTWDDKVPSWGEMSLARFITGGMLCTDPTIPPGENSQVRLHPRFRLPDGSQGVGSLYAVNTWLVWSEYLSPQKCLNCSYCFLSMFKETLPPELSVTVGMSPSRLLDYETERRDHVIPEVVSLGMGVLNGF